MKVAVVWLAAKVTSDGTLPADALLLVKETLLPPEGATAFKVTVAATEVPAVTLAEFNVSLVTEVAVVVV